MNVKNDNISKLQFDEFLRAIGISKNDTFSLLLGAGCSINSDIPSAEDCIWEWKRDIYKTNNPSVLGWIDNYKNKKSQTIIQNWLDNQGIYPEKNTKEEYSFYAYKCYPIDEHRRQYFEKICSGKTPSIGYKTIPILAKSGMLDSVWTTNLDDLIITACAGKGIQAIEISLDTVQRINQRTQNRKELPVIKLHGDFKYGELKNTEKELLNQDECFRRKLIDYIQDKHLIVIGYSGRDASLMDTLKEAYSKKGGGILYWCGYGEYINAEVENLITIAKQNGRNAFYIPTNGFDSTLRKIAQIVVEENNSLNKELIGLHLTNNDKETFTPFDLNPERVNKVLKSNIFRIEFPDEVFVFDVNIQNKPWKYVDEKVLERLDISAVPYNKQIWSFGQLDVIRTVFGEVINGDIKSTYGTGSSIMMNIGEKPIYSKSGLVTSIAWGINNKVEYVLEGNINYTGAVITWLKDNLQLINNPKETAILAENANPKDKSYLVPAFTGLGAPYWNSEVNAIITGMTRVTGKNEIVRAGLDSIAYQIADIVNLMKSESGLQIKSLKVDGGPTKNNYLMQFQSDILNIKVEVSSVEELSACGVAYMAGIALGLYDLKLLNNTIKYQNYVSKLNENEISELYKGWKNAVKQTLYNVKI